MSSNQNKQKPADNSTQDKAARKQNIFGAPSAANNNIFKIQNKNSGGINIFNNKSSQKSNQEKKGLANTNIPSKAALFGKKQQNKKSQANGHQSLFGPVIGQSQKQKKEAKPKSHNQQNIIRNQQIKYEEKNNTNQSDQSIQDKNIKKENNQLMGLLSDKNKNSQFEHPKISLFQNNQNSIFGIKKQNESNLGSNLISFNKETINTNYKKNDFQQSESLFGSSSSKSNENMFGNSSKTTGETGSLFSNLTKTNANIQNNTQKTGGLFFNIAQKPINILDKNPGASSILRPKQSAQNKQKDQQKPFSLKNPVPIQKISNNDHFKTNQFLFQPIKISNVFGSNQQNINKKQGTLQTRASQEANNLRSVEDNSRQKSKQKSIQKRQQQRIVQQPATLTQKKQKLVQKKQQLINRVAQLKKSNKQVNLQGARQKGYQQKQQQLKAKVNEMKQDIQNNRVKKQTYQRQIQQFTAESKQLKGKLEPKSQPFLLKELFKLQKQKQKQIWLKYPQKQKIIEEIEILCKSIKQFYQNNQFLQQKKLNELQLSPQQQLKSLWHKCQNSLQEIQKLKKQEKQQIGKNQTLLRIIYSFQQQQTKKIDAKLEEEHIQFSEPQHQFKKYKEEGLKKFIEKNQKLQKEYQKLVEELNEINENQRNPHKNSAVSSIVMGSVIRDFQ